jgi:hypothetical protein
MDPIQTAQALAQTIATLAALDPEARRPLLATLYKELQAAGISEPVAAALQHQIAQAADGLGSATHTTQLGGVITPAGATSIAKDES